MTLADLPPEEYRRWVLPWVKVAANNLYFTRRGRRVLSPAALAWRDEAIAIIRQDGVSPIGLPWALPWSLSLSIVAYEPDKRRRDTDGLIKPIQDAVALALGFDDTLIRRVECTRIARDPDRPPRVEVTLSRWVP